MSWGRLAVLSSIAAAIIGGLGFAGGWVASIRADAAFHERMEETAAEEKRMAEMVGQNAVLDAVQGADIASLKSAVRDLVQSQGETNVLLRQVLQHMPRFQEEQRR